MQFRLALPVAAALLLTGLAEADAQQQAAPAGAQSPCAADFLPLRQEMEKRFKAAKAGIDRQAPAAELCRLFTDFTEAEAKMIKYAEEQGVWCDIPPQSVTNMKSNHSRSLGYRKQACTAASRVQQQAPRRAAAPSLSDVLKTPVPDASTTRTGRGTFDTLSGNPLVR